MTQEKKIAINLRDAALRQMKEANYAQAKNITLAIIDQLIKETPVNNLFLDIKIELKKL